ncbi:MAG: chemotaxis protein methyltransferase CheR [Myxococcales bacterium]|nr:chemotaxis protein methyltransferase CheR [Myxococcales bacterium]
MLRGLLVGALSTAALTAFKLAYRDSIGFPTPFLLYFGAVAASAWYGGLTAGLVTTLVSGLGANYFFQPPIHTFYFATPAIALRFALFAAEGATISWLTAMMQQARQRSLVGERDARSALARLDVVMGSVDEGITVQDESGRLVYANDTAARIIGFQSATALTDAPVAEILRAFDIYYADGRPFPLTELPGRVLFAGRTPGEELVRFRARTSGADRWSVMRASPVRDADGKLLYAINLFRDVTERQRHEEALRVSQEWFSTALRSIGDAVIATSRSGEVTFMNPVAEQLTGWPLVEALGRALPEVFPIFSEATREPAEAPVERVLREGVVVGMANPTLLRHRDGSETAIDDSAAPIRGSDGSIVGVVLVFRDVSLERREEQRRAYLARATEQLNSSLEYEQTLKTIADQAVPLFADWCAVDMVVDGAVRRLAAAHIDPAKIALVADIERRYPPDPNAPTGTPNIRRTGRPEWLRDIPESALEAGARDAEHLALIRQLELRSYIGVPIKRRSEVVGVITFVMAESKRRYDEDDVTLATSLADRASVAIENARLFREAERLRLDADAQRQRLEAMIMAAPTAICVLRGPDLTFELMNEPYRRRLGHGAQAGARVDAMHLDPQNVAMLRRVFESGEPASAVEAPVTADYASGRQTRYLSYVVQPLHDAALRVDRVVIFAEDVTEQVLSRQQLQAARAKAELANRVKDEFLAILGHELRNPLAPILTALQLMKLRAPEALERERTIIERQVRHVVRLVDDLLDVSRITRGKVELKNEVVNIADVVAKALEMAGPLFEERAHEVQLSVADSLFVLADPVRLAQVVANLLNNAAKYTEPRGRIEIDGRREADSIVVRVRDTGMGIAPEMLPRVFDLFVQERQTIDRAQGGLGLGLAIVRSLVAAHGGTVAVRSDGLGKGAEFELRLPAIDGAPATRSAPAEEPETAAVEPCLRVLVVDDNADALELLVEGLEMMGHELHRAHDGPTALTVAGEVKPALAILDIGLPVMDGYELARRLRALPGLTGIKLVALTGYGQETDRKRSAEAGFDDHLVKPVSIEQVQASVAKLHRP